jgi:bifunctional non-homologous end joining protein LigD
MARAAKVVAGARKAPYPGFIEPSHPTLVAQAPSGTRWRHEIKVDGYRCQLHIRDGELKALTRRGYDWAQRFRSVIDAALGLRVSNAILDGEIIVPGEKDLSDFAALQAELAAGKSERMIYYAFDLLYLDGYDLRAAQLTARKQKLQQLLAAAKQPRLVFSEEFSGDGQTLHARVCRAGLEGLVSKRRDSRYQSGRNDNWLKVTCRKRDTFRVVGFIAGPAATVAAIYVARKLDGELIYAGKAATGFTGETARELRRRLDPLKRKTSPLTRSVRKPKATWVEPQLPVDLEYRGITGDGRLRHTSFKGVRDDLAPQRRPPARDAAKLLAYNIQRQLPDAVVPGKDELRDYWRKVAKSALKYLAGRPLTLVRHVDGITFFHTRRLPQMRAAVRAVHFEKREGGEGVRAYVTNVQGLLGLIDMDVVELHPWNAKVDDIEHPDQMVFDLDPGDDVPWDFVTATALSMRRMLQQEGFDPWPKATGGKGLHLMIPVAPLQTHDEVSATAKRLAAQFAKTDSRYTVLASVARRRGKIFIDYLRNGRGQTAIGAFSPRARVNFPIAAPFSWTEVQRNLPSDAYTMHRLPPL